MAIGVCVLAAGCPAGDDGSGVGEASSAGEEGGDGGGGPTTTSSTGMIADSSGDTTGAPVPEMIPARDIAIDWVEAN